MFPPSPSTFQPSQSPAPPSPAVLAALETKSKPPDSLEAQSLDILHNLSPPPVSVPSLSAVATSSEHPQGSADPLRQLYNRSSLEPDLGPDQRKDQTAPTSEVRLFIHAPEAASQSMPYWVLVHESRPDRLWCLPSAVPSAAESAAGLKYTAFRIFSATTSLNPDEYRFEELGTHRHQEVVVTTFAVRLPKRCAHRSSGLTLAFRTQWQSAITFQDGVARDQYGSPPGAPLTEFALNLGMTLGEPTGTAGFPRPHELNQAEWVSVLQARRAGQSLSAQLNSSVGSLAFGAAGGGNSAPPILVEGSSDPEVAPLFWIDLRFLDPSGRRRTVRALVDSGSQMDIMSVEVATQLGLEHKDLTKVRTANGAIAGSKNAIRSYVEWTFELGDRNVASAIVEREYKLFLMPCAIPVILGKQWLYHLESRSADGVIRARWQHNALGLAVDGNVVIVSGANPFSPKIASDLPQLMASMAHDLIKVLAHGDISAGKALKSALHPSNDSAAPVVVDSPNLSDGLIQLSELLSNGANPGAAQEQPVAVILPLDSYAEWAVGVCTTIRAGDPITVVTPDWRWHPGQRILERAGFTQRTLLDSGTPGAYIGPTGSEAANPWRILGWSRPKLAPMDSRALFSLLGKEVHGPEPEYSDYASFTVTSAPTASTSESAGLEKLALVESYEDGRARPIERWEHHVRGFVEYEDEEPSVSAYLESGFSSRPLVCSVAEARPLLQTDWDELASEAVDDPEQAFILLLHHASSDADVRVSIAGSVAALTEEERKTLAEVFDPARYDESFDEDKLSSDRTMKHPLTSEQQAGLDALMDQFAKQFSDVTHFDDSAGRPPAYDMEIRLKDEASYPPRRKPQRLSPQDFEELKKQLDVMIKSGFITPSNSPFGAPILFVPKKGGARRFAVDYRALNDMTVPNVTPLPTVDDMLQQLQGSSVFSKIDMTWMFWQLRIKESDRHKAAMVTPLGHFDWKVVPFGLTNAPGHCMNVISSVLQPFLYRFCMVLLDDIIVYSKSVEEHLEHLRLIFEALEVAKLFIKRSKCEFCVARLHYLGHVVSAAGIEAEGDKLQAMRAFPIPSSVRDVRAFLGLTGYYRKLIRDYSKVAAPLTDVTKGGADGPVELTDEQRRCFEHLKLLMLTAPILRFMDPLRPYVLQVDASSYAIGGVLMQADDGGALHPVGYFSKKLSSAQQNYTVTGRELLAITEAIKHWRTVLFGCKGGLTIHTDHRPLSFLRTVQPLGLMHARWLELIESIPFTLVHRPGSTMGPADTLSRRPDHADVQTGGAETKGQAVPLPEHPDNIPTLMAVGSACSSAMIPSLPSSGVILPSALLLYVEEDALVYAFSMSALPAFTAPVSTRSRTRRLAARGAGGETLAESAPTEVTPPPATANLAPALTRDHGEFAPGVPFVVKPDELLEIEQEVATSSAAHAEFLADLRAATAQDPMLATAQRSDPDKMFLLNGVIYCIVKGLAMVYIPEPLRSTVIKMHHEPVYCGHLSASKTEEHLRRAFWWNNMQLDVAQYCKECRSCQTTKRSTQLPYGSPHPFPAPERRFEVITMDEVSGYPTTPRGNHRAWVFVDKLTKFLTVVPFGDTCTAMDIAQALLDRIVQYWGLPRKIVSDRDPRLAGEVYQTLCRLWAIRANISTARHPQTDGQSENSVGTITQLLRAYVNHNASDWDLLLPSLCFAYNDSIHPSTGFTPLFLCHGAHPSTPLSLLARDLASEISAQPRQQEAGLFVETVARNIDRARRFLERARVYMEKRMTLKVRSPPFKAGDLVLLNHSASGILGTKNGKLDARWLGPFRILETRHSNAYKLDLPPVMRIEPVVNVRFLKPFYSSTPGDVSPSTLQAPISRFINYRIVLDSDDFYRAELSIETAPPGQASGLWITLQQSFDAGQFAMAREYLASLPGLSKPSNFHLGREVLDWRFRVPGIGLVASFDPKEAAKQYEIIYEDGDSDWISLRHLLKILVPPSKEPREPRRAKIMATLAPHPVRILVLFSGTDSVGRFFRKFLPSSTSVLSLDSNFASPNALHIDVLDWEYHSFPPGFFDFVWASPPCTHYSKARISGPPPNLEFADSLVCRTLEIIRHLAPPFWILENPEGKLRERDFMAPLLHLRQTTSYCLWQDPFRKNTDLWIWPPLYPPLTPCTPNNPCVQIKERGQHFRSASHGPARGVPGAGSLDILYKIPERLLETVCRPFFARFGPSTSLP